MTEQEVQALIMTGLPDSQTIVNGDGYHFTVRVISPCFEGLSTIKRQQCVYATVASEIQSGALHALTMKTFTPEEWNSHASSH